MENKHKVVTDALQTLGNIIEDGGRDAIHLAVEPIIAAEDLYAGQHIGLVNGKASTKAEKKVGVVDPFINGVIPEGKMFWLVVYPRQITSLRHVWTHPDFEIKEPEINEDEAWIVAFAARVGLMYDVVMRGADDWLHTHDGKYGGEYLCFGGLLEGEYVPDEFWEHYEKVRNVKVESEKRGSFFTCSC